MKIDRYRSDPSQTPYAPNWDLPIGYSSIPLRIDRLVAFFRNDGLPAA